MGKIPELKTFTLNKEEINRMPLCSFPGKIYLIDTPVEIRRAMLLLKGESLLGLDTESRPSFKKGRHFPIALIQIAVDFQVFLFRVSRIGMPPHLKVLLENPRVTKIALGTDQELIDLAQDHDVRGRAFVDLLPEAKRLGCSPQGVRGLAAIFLGFRISKSAQRSNWAREVLTEKQLRYAATDAWVCLKIFQQMKHRGLLLRPLRRLDYTSGRRDTRASRSKRRRSGTPDGSGRESL